MENGKVNGVIMIDYGIKFLHKIKRAWIMLKKIKMGSFSWNFLILLNIMKIVNSA